MILKSDEEFVGEGRAHIIGAIAPFLSPYLNVDVGENLNKLGNAENTAFFLTRDIYIVSQPRDSSSLESREVN